MKYSSHTLRQEIQVFELEEPVGWVRFPLREQDDR